MCSTFDAFMRLVGNGFTLIRIHCGKDNEEKNNTKCCYHLGVRHPLTPDLEGQAVSDGPADCGGGVKRIAGVNVPTQYADTGIALSR